MLSFYHGFFSLYSRSSITCNPCMRLGSPYYHASTGSHIPHGCPLQCARCVIDGNQCGYALDLFMLSDTHLCKPNQLHPLEIVCRDFDQIRHLVTSYAQCNPSYSTNGKGDQKKGSLMCYQGKDGGEILEEAGKMISFDLDMVWFEGIEQFGTWKDIEGMCAYVGGVKLAQAVPATDPAAVVGSHTSKLQTTPVPSSQSSLSSAACLPLRATLRCSNTRHRRSLPPPCQESKLNT